MNRLLLFFFMLTLVNNTSSTPPIDVVASNVTASNLDDHEHYVYCMHSWWYVEETGYMHVDVDSALAQIMLFDIEEWFGVINETDGHLLYDMHFEYDVINMTTSSSSGQMYYITTSNIVAFDHEVVSINYTDLYHEIELDWNLVYPSSRLHFASPYLPSGAAFSAYNGSCHVLPPSFFRDGNGSVQIIHKDSDLDTDGATSFSELLQVVLVPAIFCILFCVIAAFLLWFLEIRRRRIRQRKLRQASSTAKGQSVEMVIHDVYVKAAPPANETPRPPPRQAQTSPTPRPPVRRGPIQRIERQYSSPVALVFPKPAISDEKSDMSDIVNSAPQLPLSPPRSRSPIVTVLSFDRAGPGNQQVQPQRSRSARKVRKINSKQIKPRSRSHPRARSHLSLKQQFQPYNADLDAPVYNYMPPSPPVTINSDNPSSLTTEYSVSGAVLQQRDVPGVIFERKANEQLNEEEEPSVSNDSEAMYDTYALPSQPKVTEAAALDPATLAIGEPSPEPSVAENDDVDADAHEQTAADINKGKLNDAMSVNSDVTHVLQVVCHDDVMRWFDTKLKSLLTARHTYCRMFIENGFENMAVIKTMTDRDLLDIGITKLGHRKQILSEIQKL